MISWPNWRGALRVENEVKVLRKAAAAVEQVVPQKVRFALVAELGAEGILVKEACLVLGVSRLGVL